jgi:hypothetical protein
MDEKEIEQQARSFCHRLGFNPEQDVLLDGERKKLWERYADELRKRPDPETPLASEHTNRAQDAHDPIVNSRQAAPLLFWIESPVAAIAGDAIILKTKPGHNQDRVVSIEYDPKDGEFVFTEQCDECFWVSHKKADAIAALEEAIRWIKSKP